MAGESGYCLSVSVSWYVPLVAELQPGEGIMSTFEDVVRQELGL